MLARVFAKEGVRWVKGKATAARPCAFGAVSSAGHAVAVAPSTRGLSVDQLLAAQPVEVRGDVLLVAVGRAARVDGLGLGLAGVALTADDKVKAELSCGRRRYQALFSTFFFLFLSSSFFFSFSFFFFFFFFFCVAFFFVFQGISVNAKLRTSNQRVFAAGDCTGGPQYTHVAGFQVNKRRACLPD